MIYDADDIVLCVANDQSVFEVWQSLLIIFCSNHDNDSSI